MYRAVLFVLLVIAAVPIAFFRPFPGLLIYLWISFGRPGDFMWPDFRFDYTIWIACALLLGYAAFEMPRSPLRLKGMWLVFLLWIWLAVTSVTAQDPMIALPKLWEYSRTFGMAFLTAALANSEKRVRSILFVLAISLGLLGAKGAFDAITTGFASSMKGPGGMMFDQNEYALTLNMGIPILFWLMKDDPRRWLRLLFQLMAFGCAIVVIGTRSRSGFLGLIAAALVIAAFSKHKLLLSAGAIIALALLLLFGPQGALDRYKTIPTAAQTDGSAIGRIQAWKAAIKMTIAHPITGVGPRNFMLEFPKYSDAKPRVTHNVIFDMLSETGIPGCILFLSIILAAIGEMYVWRFRAAALADTELETFCRILLAVLIVYLVPNMFINRQDFDLLYQLVAVEAGVVGLLRQKSAQRMTQPENIEPDDAVVPLWARVQGRV